MGEIKLINNQYCEILDINLHFERLQKHLHAKNEKKKMHLISQMFNTSLLQSNKQIMWKTKQFIPILVF